MRSRRYLLLALGLVFLLGQVVPYGRILLYPFTLLATLVHETGHGLTALATGGHFERLKIFWDGSGYAVTQAAGGWPTALTCLGGLLAPPIAGAALFLFARGPRRARVALALLALALAAVTVLWVRSPAGLTVVPLVALLLAVVTLRRSNARHLVLAQLLAVTLSFDTLGRLISYAVSPTAQVNGKVVESDVARIAHAVGGSYYAWGLGVIVVALALLALGLWAAWRTPRSARVPGRVPA